MGAGLDFAIDADPTARDWLATHRAAAGWVIAYEEHRCCGGGKICEVGIRPRSAKDKPEDRSVGVLDDGTSFLIDRKAAVRLPHRFGLTVRGVGRWKHLDLQLTPDQWGDLLYL